LSKEENGLDERGSPNVLTTPPLPIPLLFLNLNSLPYRRLLEAAAEVVWILLSTFSFIEKEDLEKEVGPPAIDRFLSL